MRYFMNAGRSTAKLTRIDDSYMVSMTAMVTVTMSILVPMPAMIFVVTMSILCHSQHEVITHIYIWTHISDDMS